MSLSSQRHSAISQGQSSAWLNLHSGGIMPLVSALVWSPHGGADVAAAGTFKLYVEGNLPYQAVLSGTDISDAEVLLADTPSSQGWMDTEASATWIATKIAADANYTSAAASGNEILVTVASATAAATFSIDNYPDVSTEASPALPQDGWTFPTP